MTVSKLKDDKGYAIHILHKMYVMYGDGSVRNNFADVGSQEPATLDSVTLY